MKHKFKIFVIDDNPGFTMALQIHLEKKGHDVITFNKATDFPLDGNNLCPCSKGTTCGDFLIIDQQMPDMNGLDFIHLLSQSGCKGILRNTLLMSGWLTREEESKACELGCEVLHKPFEFNEILNWIEKRIQLV